LCKLEEIKWQQRFKINWLKLGDKNKKFFYAVASTRKRANHIQNLHK
jgi:hypothetical protein